MDALNSMIVTSKMKSQLSGRKQSVFSNNSNLLHSEQNSVLQKKLEELEDKMDTLQTENEMLQEVSDTNSTLILFEPLF